MSRNANKLPTLLLFDIDGTIIIGGGAGMRAMYRTAEEMFGPIFKWDGVESAGNLDPLIYEQATTANSIADWRDHHGKFHDSYIKDLHEEFTTTARALVRRAPGIVPTIELLRERVSRKGDIVLGLLTGNYTKAVPIKLAAVDVDPTWFPITAFGDEGRTRADLVAVAMAKYEQTYGSAPNPKRVIVIGDTPRDVACARAHGCISLAVATGSHTLAVLEACEPDVAVSDLGDPTPLLELISKHA